MAPRRITGHSRIAALNLNPVAWLNLDSHNVVQCDGLIDRQQAMKAVRARRPDLQSEIDLGKGTQCDGHGEWSVAGGQWLV